MRNEKKSISAEYLAQLNESPFLILVDYQGLKVDQFAELRSRLAKVGAQLHVVKNRIFRIAAQESEFGEDLSADLKGQVAVVTGEQDISAAAKITKNFQAEFEKPVIKMGCMGQTRLDAEQVKIIADLPSLDELRAKVVGVLQAPAQKLVRLLQTPASQLAQVIKANAEKKQD